MKKWGVDAGLCKIAQLQCGHPLQPGRPHTHQHVEQNWLAVEGHEGDLPPLASVLSPLPALVYFLLTLCITIYAGENERCLDCNCLGRQ